MRNRILMLVTVAILFSAGSFSAYAHQEGFVFIGNPGVGKSTLVNSLVGEQVFESGLSATGVTKFCQSYEHNGVLYVDTPGLSDTQLRRQAALEIERALKKNRWYKIFFVVTIEGGRIKPDDLHTINRVMEAINNPDKKFNVIFNKIIKREQQEIFETETAYNAFCDQLARNGHQAVSICSIELDRDLDDNKSEFIAIKDRVKRFIFQDSKGFYLNSDQVSAIDPQTAEELRQHMQAEEYRLRNEAEQQRQRNEEQQRRLDELRVIEMLLMGDGLEVQCGGYGDY